MTVHLFRKDLRRLWILVFAVAALTVLQSYVLGHQTPRFDELSMRWRQMEGLLIATTMFGWAFLVVLAVQEDGLTGSDEDWLTRPVGWRRLLSAKLLFMAAAVMAPMTLSEIYVVWAQGFSPWQHLPGLLTHVILTTGTFVLPAFGLATVTKNLAQAVLGGFLFTLAMTAAESIGVLQREGLGEIDWVRSEAGFVLVCTVAVVVTVWQYATRRTVVARVASVVGAVLVIGVPASLTWGAAKTVESLRSRQAAGLEVRIAERVGEALSMPTPARWQFGESNTWVALPLEVSGIREPERLRLSGGHLELIASDGDRLRLGAWAELLRRVVSADGRTNYRLLLDLSADFYRRHSEEPLRLEADLEFGLVLADMPLTLRTGGPVLEVPGVGRCSAYYSRISVRQQLYVDCKRPFRMTAAMEAVVRQPGRLDAFSEQQVSGRGMFDPLPARVDFGPMVESFATWREPLIGSEVVVTPLTGVRLVNRQLNASGIRLKDFVVGR